MICQTTKEGVECAFMSKNGCTFNGGSCKPIVEQCDGCARVVEYPSGKYCSAYPNPAQKWKGGTCNFASHIKREVKKEKVINALKASKRRAAGR